MTYLNTFREPVRIRCDEDLLALIPHQLGHEPRNCAVLFIPVNSGGALCLRMPLPDGTEDHASYVQHLENLIQGIGHTGHVSVVVYADDAAGTNAESAMSKAAWLGMRLEDCGLQATTGHAVGPHEWWNIACPTRPRPVSAVRDSHVNAHMVSLGSCVQPHAPEDVGHAAPGIRARSASFHRALERRGRTPDATAGSAGASPWEELLHPSMSPRECAHVWHTALSTVGTRSTGWVDALLSLSDAHLCELAVSLSHGLIRDTLFYSWLTGDPHRVLSAHAGLRAALAEALHGPPPDHTATLESPVPDAEGGTVHSAAVDQVDVTEGLRCAHTVMGQWEGAPCWEVMETAYRILEGLDGLFSCAYEDSPHNPVQSGAAQDRYSRSVHADVVSARAQLEVYRGRTLTAHGLLERAEQISPRRGSTAAVLRRIQVMDLPWWGGDPATAWPGEKWWFRGCPAPTVKKWP